MKTETEYSATCPPPAPTVPVKTLEASYNEAVRNSYQVRLSKPDIKLVLKLREELALVMLLEGKYGSNSTTSRRRETLNAELQEACAELASTSEG